MLINKEVNTENKYFTITAGKEGSCQGLEQKDLLELAMELVDLLKFSQLTTLYNKVDYVWCAKKDKNYVEDAMAQLESMLYDLRKIRELV